MSAGLFTLFQASCCQMRLKCPGCRSARSCGTAPQTLALVSDQAGPPILYDLSRFKSERSGRSVVGQSLARLSILYLARRNIDNEFGELGGVAWGAYEGCSGEQLGPRDLAQWALPVMQAGVFFDPAIAACSLECEVSA
jgi:hypothetical protein